MGSLIGLCFEVGDQRSYALTGGGQLGRWARADSDGCAIMASSRGTHRFGESSARSFGRTFDARPSGTSATKRNRASRASCRARLGEDDVTDGSADPLGRRWRRSARRGRRSPRAHSATRSSARFAGEPASEQRRPGCGARAGLGRALTADPRRGAPRRGARAVRPAGEAGAPPARRRPRRDRGRRGEARLLDQPLQRPAPAPPLPATDPRQRAVAAATLLHGRLRGRRRSRSSWSLPPAPTCAPRPRSTPSAAAPSCRA